VTDAGELHGLADFGIVQLDLDFERSTRTDQGNLLGMVGSFERADGSKGEMIDVWFAKADAPALPGADELLAHAPAAVLPGAPPATVPAAPPAATAEPSTAGTTRGLFDDDLRGTPLI